MTALSWRKTVRGLRGLALASAAALAAQATALGATRLVGSDLLGAAFAQSVIDYARREEIALTLDLSGSRGGLAELKAGRADFGLIVLPPGEEPPGGEFKSMPVAYQVAEVLVRSNSPLAQINFRELGGIFGAAESASFTRWGELGLSGEWTSRAIAPQATAPKAGLALELFRRQVLSDGQLRSVVILQPSTSALLRKLEADEGGIAVTGAVTALPDDVRVLPVAKSEHDVAFGPTPENVHAGDYPLRLPLWLVVRRESARPQLNFLRYLLSEDAAPFFEQAGLVPLPLTARNQLVFDLEQL